MRTSYTIVSDDNGDSECWTGTQWTGEWKHAARWTNLWSASLALAAVARRSNREVYLAKWVATEPRRRR